MARTNASARAAGGKFERSIADCLMKHLDDQIDRRVKRGANDRGDIGGVRTVTGEKVVIECKEYGGRLLPGTWIKEAQVEAANDSAQVGIVVAKRKGEGDPLKQWVLMEVRDLVILLGGEASDVEV